MVTNVLGVLVFLAGLAIPVLVVFLVIDWVIERLDPKPDTRRGFEVVRRREGE